jgi:hypothetical protein
VYIEDEDARRIAIDCVHDRNLQIAPGAGQVIVYNFEAGENEHDPRAGWIVSVKLDVTEGSKTVYVEIFEPDGDVYFICDGVVIKHSVYRD